MLYMDEPNIFFTKSTIMLITVRIIEKMVVLPALMETIHIQHVQWWRQLHFLNHKHYAQMNDYDYFILQTVTIASTNSINKTARSNLS